MPSLIKKILLITYTPNPQMSGVVANPSYIDDVTKTEELRIKGCIDWVVYNLGTAKLYLFDRIEVLPGQSFTLPKSSPLPFLENIKLKFEGDYRITRNTADINTPPDLTTGHSS